MSVPYRWILLWVLFSCLSIYGELLSQELFPLIITFSSYCILYLFTRLIASCYCCDLETSLI